MYLFLLFYISFFSLSFRTLPSFFLFLPLSLSLSHTHTHCLSLYILQIDKKNKVHLYKASIFFSFYNSSFSLSEKISICYNVTCFVLKKFI
ncbi:hypothetical protein BDA99DRAFT_294818 [Phascolomyces articulosus]|uniref:Uncharacterized protein n=1 Tax=Phascolomyces articulosus TaxID=60185 RepID=A0AAD5JM61_9FUNG|nr:hypothetical protein BDA99DRAFT_294818 [Phascolomyces articulosus]